MDKIELFKNELVLRHYAITTTQTYVSCAKIFIYKIGDHPSIEQIKNFLISINNYSYRKQMVGAIHRYFEFVLKEELLFADIPYPRRSYRLPEIMSIDEVQQIFNQCSNLKHRSILCLFYGCGLRMSELLNLKISDIDSERMVLNIRQAKGFKDRQVPINHQLLIILRQYYSFYRPKEYLFNGQFGNQYSSTSVNSLLKYYAKKAGIKKRVHAHKLRHCYATHLLESGTELTLIQKLLGHKNLKTTQIYTYISSALLAKVNSPINNISL